MNNLNPQNEAEETIRFLRDCDSSDLNQEVFCRQKPIVAKSVSPGCSGFWAQAVGLLERRKVFQADYQSFIDQISTAAR